MRTVFFIMVAAVLSTLAASAAEVSSALTNCECAVPPAPQKCGSEPAFMSKAEVAIARELGFDVPGDNVHMAGTLKGKALYHAFASFLEKSDRARMFYPQYFTKAADGAAELTLDTVFVPKNVTEVDEYFRCTIPSDKYCHYRSALRPYIGLAAKASGFDYSFLSCQSYVESRFNRNARSAVGAIGYSQIRPMNVQYLNQVLAKSIRATEKSLSASRALASVASGPRQLRINKVQDEITRLWTKFWEGTSKAPKKLCVSDLTCHRLSFLAQVLSLKTDMLAFATSSRGVKADFDESGDFRIEGMDKADSLLLLAGSYNLGVTKMIKLVSNFCSGSTKLKDCLDKIWNGTKAREMHQVVDYITRIRDCSQQFSAERIDFDEDERWTHSVRKVKYDQQRHEVVQCLLNPCPLK